MSTARLWSGSADASSTSAPNLDTARTKRSTSAWFRPALRFGTACRTGTMGGKIARVLHRNKQSAARVFSGPDQTSAPGSKRLSNQTRVIRLQLLGPIEYQDSSALRETERGTSHLVRYFLDVEIGSCHNKLQSYVVDYYERAEPFFYLVPRPIENPTRNVMRFASLWLVRSVMLPSGWSTMSPLVRKLVIPF